MSVHGVTEQTSFSSFGLEVVRTAKTEAVGICYFAAGPMGVCRGVN